jgi:hypothetical protein
MTLQHVLWAGLALTLVGTAMGCVEWYRGRGAKQALSSIPGILVYIVMLAGPQQHPWLAVVSFVVAVGFFIYMMATMRHGIPWQSAPGICFVLLVVLFAVMVALPDDAPRGVLTAVFYALMAVLVAMGAVTSWMLYKAMVRARATSR